MSGSNGAMPASVLAGVLVISTLIFISVMMVMSLWDCELLFFSVFFEREQQKADLSSAMVCYCRDSSFRNKFLQDSSLFLFPETETSEVKLRWKQWGLYEVVTIEAGNCRTTRLVGRVKESFCGAGLYIPDNRKALDISGDSRIEGKLYLSSKGISYTQVGKEFFRGIPVSASQITQSRKEFPAFDQRAVRWVEDVLKQTGTENFSGGTPRIRSFGDPLACWRVEGEISGEHLSGHILLCGDGEVYIRRDNYLRNIIVVARKVSVEQGFSGSLQIFARDTVLLGDSVVLKAGSGLWVEGKGQVPLIRLGDNCEVNGFVVLRGNSGYSSGCVLNYMQPLHSAVNGLVFVDGTAQVQGKIDGSLFVRDLRYFTPAGYYSDLLYRLSLFHGRGVVYPLLLAGPYERKEVV